MNDFALAILVCGTVFALSWGFRGCNSENTKVIKANAQVQLEQEKTKQLQYQWKIDSLRSKSHAYKYVKRDT